MRPIALLIVFLIAFMRISAQNNEPKVKRIEIIYGGEFTIDNVKYPGATIFKTDGKKVQFRHQGLDVWCDLAVLYEEKNEVIAHGDVLVQQGDTLQMNSQYISYNGNLKTAIAKESVVLRNETMTLETEELFLDRNTQEAYYNNFGKITDVENELTSKTGKYFIEKKKNQFTNSVKIVNKDFVVDSQVLDYYHPTGNAYFYGATTITGKDYKVYCERGFYDTRQEEGYFKKNAVIDYDLKTLKGDSLYFDKKRNFASGTNNIVVIDTVNQTIVKGHYGEIHKARDSMFITKKPVIISLVEKDSMYMHGKKILVTGKEKSRVIRVYPDARIFKSDMQAKCDSIHSVELNGLTQLIGKPVVWTGESQMTGDSIHLIANTKTEQLDSLKVFHNALVVEKDTLGDGYNQVKGKTLYGKFKKNQLKQIDFMQNTESIYYVYNDKNERIGINKLTCSHIKLYLDDKQQVEQVVFITQPSGNLYPEDKLDKNDRKFREFIWRGDERIHSKDEIFSEEEKNQPLIKIQEPNTPEENDLEEAKRNAQQAEEKSTTEEL
ncbi:OstA-like protein [Capnocytophaga sp.]|uniref:OstA-like protein n=1 Tax=Capnocytophaga sp. TaxID=44737 RepID=UPI0026DCD57A|nr:OstA-like protein [Capnocytophaga sp.]MDO5105851.1 OstA-like protein [Capnocytophaga sp.]